MVRPNRWGFTVVEEVATRNGEGGKLPGVLRTSVMILFGYKKEDCVSEQALRRPATAF